MWWMRRKPIRRRKNPEIKLFIFTDNHLRADVDGDTDHPDAISGNRYYYASNAKIRRFVDIANAEQPDIAIHLGDMVDTPHDFPFFNTEWAKIEGVQKEIVIGNHDFDDFTYEGIVSELGYDNKQTVVGSKFNQSFSMNEDGFSVRIIMLDTNYDLNGNHVNTARGAIKSEAFAWLDTEINSASEDYILLFSHHGAHLYNDPETWPYFVESHAMQLKDIIDNSGKKVYGLFGHHHTANIVQYDNLGVNFPGYRLPDTIVGETGKFTTVKITSDGLTMSTTDLQYPYP